MNGAGFVGYQISLSIIGTIGVVPVGTCDVLKTYC